MSANFFGEISADLYAHCASHQASTVPLPLLHAIDVCVRMDFHDAGLAYGELDPDFRASISRELAGLQGIVQSCNKGQLRISARDVRYVVDDLVGEGGRESLRILPPSAVAAVLRPDGARPTTADWSTYVQRERPQLPVAVLLAWGVACAQAPDAAVAMVDPRNTELASLLVRHAKAHGVRDWASAMAAVVKSWTQKTAEDIAGLAFKALRRCEPDPSVLIELSTCYFPTRGHAVVIAVVRSDEVVNRVGWSPQAAVPASLASHELALLQAALTTRHADTGGLN